MESNLTKKFRVGFSNRSLSVLTLLGLVSFLILACNGDDGVSSEFSSVSGTITFENVAMWPDSGEVQITVWPEGIWTANGPMGPPQNPNNPLTLSKSGSQTAFQYSIDGLPEGSYSAIAVGWRTPDENVPADRRSAVLGVYLETPQPSTGVIIQFPNSPFQGPLPDTFTLARGESRAGMNIRADFANIALFFPGGL